MLVKVCGMRNVENINELIQSNIDLIGFIFFEGSKRYLEKIPVKIPGHIKKVGVFVNESYENVIQTAKHNALDYIQFHGDEKPELCKAVKDANYCVIKAFQIDMDFDFNKLTGFEHKCDLFLFDTKGKNYGGNGIKFNWELLDKYKGDTPFLLSGGISSGDVKEILDIKHKAFAGIDLNSGFESEPGLKEVCKINSFIHKVKGKPMNYFKTNEKGFYGKYGGAFIPELLYANVKELQDNYEGILESKEFKEEYRTLLKDYVGRPTPLYYAKRLSLKYNSNIYLKREDLAHTGAHKINNTIGQILLAKSLGKKRIIAETGAGQHGVATATVCALYDLECVVYMGEVDMKRQAPNVARMKMLGAEVRAAKSGSKTLKDAVNEAIRDWINNPKDTYYLIGSVVGPHPYPDIVSRLQSVISKEIKEQLKYKTGKETPDKLIACVGGGSNAAGAFYHFSEEEKVTLIAVEAEGKGIHTGKTAATTQIGSTGILHGSKTLLMQDSYGQVIEPYSISAGLDYPGIGPVHAHLFETKRAEFIGATDNEAVEAAMELSQLEGIIPALESAHACAALKKINLSCDDIVVINLSGRGDKDMDTYMELMKKNKQL